MLPQSACISAFHCAWVSAHGCIGGGRWGMGAAARVSMAWVAMAAAAAAVAADTAEATGGGRA